MKTVTTFPKLFARASNGKVKQWQIEAVKSDTHVFASIVTSHGYADGTIQENEKEVKGKSIGRSNETTSYEQAIKDAQSKWNKKKDKKYVEDIKQIDKVDILLPMLAHRFDKRKHNIVYPAYVQPKLNGVRCLVRRTKTGFEFTSRKFKTFTTLDHLIPSLKKIMKVDDIADGEVFHPDWTFQRIIRAIKKFRDDSLSLQYWIYDKAEEITFERRLLWLDNAKFTGHLRKVATVAVYSEKDIYRHHKKFSRDYEGTMVRNADGVYRFDHRSADLQKVKNLYIDGEADEKEFVICGGKQGTGNDKGCIIFEVDNPKGKTPKAKAFDVRPRGSVKQRKKWYKELPSLLGEKLTVRYDGLSEDNVPIFPVGICIRNYE